MYKISETIHGVLDGKILLTNVRKYSVIIYSVCVVHVFLFLFFACLHVLPLMIFNIFSVAMYLSLHLFVKRENYLACFFMTYGEICIHTIFAMCILGRDTGFIFFNLALVPVSFYIGFTTNTFKKKMVYPMLLMVGNLILTACATAYMFYGTPIYGDALSHDEVFLMNAFNVAVAFVFLAVFSILFVVEIRNNQYAMKMQNVKLNYYAQYDPLTSLLNRRSMEERMIDMVDEILREGTSYCIAISDIDDFKHVNDSFGHECGDKALVHIAGTLRGMLPETDTVCRWGGEEFLFMLQGDAEECKKKVEIMRSAVEKIDFYFNRRRVKFTMTFGLQYYQPGLNIERAISMADDKLYQGKMKGKNQVVS